ncbi:MAG: MBOAT family protein [Chloroflexi bacterium]|nr:MBOAT family protein [Chloroflexota bacterium]
MSFISPEYVIFFCLVLPLYFWLPYRWRWPWLLLISYFFYGYAFPQYVILMAAVTVVNYYAGLALQRVADGRQRRFVLAASLGLDVALLGFFKYFNFFSASFAALFGLAGLTYPLPQINVILPIGISFHTFQAMGYLIDVYRRRIEPERHAGIFATFIIFFPQLVAGPIERAKDMLPQFGQRFDFDEGRAVEGLRQILWGFFKKVVIADRLAIYVNAVYDHPQEHSGLVLILATVFFAFQIYCDFSGYSDIAFGTAKIMGFHLTVNFRQPYFALSVREFWRRWHISLSTWFRDYLYIPLGGSRGTLARTLLNLMIVFVVSGLWHGASWTFVVWGALHGVYAVMETLWEARGRRLLPANRAGAAVRWTLTFAAVCFAWIFFRADNFTDAAYIIGHLFSLTGADISAPFAGGLLAPSVEFGLALGLIGVLLAVDRLDGQYTVSGALARAPAAARWGLYYGAAAAVLFSGMYGSGAQQFIYFQF